MITTRRRLPLQVALAVMAGVMSPLPSSAQSDPYAWYDCSWNAENSVTVRTYNYPANGTGDGVTNSFVDRFIDAVANWNAQLNLLSEANYTLVRITAGTPDISVTYGNTGSGAIGVASRSVPSGTSCNLQGSTPTDIVGGTITTLSLPRSGNDDSWFTQDNSRRALWESCPGLTQQQQQQQGITYTCSRDWDAGSTFVHELGHAMGLGHPSQVTGGNQQASCGSDQFRASMCIPANRYRTEKRTPESYDREALRRALVNS